MTEKRMTDLDWLKSLGGPFTKPQEVDEYISNSAISNEDKQKRLYREVRYARDTTLSLPKTSDIFKLKEKYKSLSVERLATNIKVYLSKVSANASADCDDFNNAIAHFKSALNA